MKNVVIDIHDRYAVVLTDAGDFKKIFNSRNLKIGDEFVEKAKGFVPGLTRTLASIAAIFVLGFIASFYYLNFTPHGYIDVRINPGVKITLNAMDKVIGVDGLNQDGMDLLANINQKESDPQKILDSIVSKAAEMGFFKAGNPVRITVAIKDPGKVTTMENTLMETAQKALDNNSVSVPVSAFSIDVKDYKSLESDRKIETAKTPKKADSSNMAVAAAETDTNNTAVAADTTVSDDDANAEDTTDYSPAWKEKTVKPSICDVRFSGGNIIIEFNHKLTLDNAKVFAYPDKDPALKIEAKIVASKNDKLTVSFDSLTPGETYKLEATGVASKDGSLLDPITARIIQPAYNAKNDGGDEDETDSAQRENNGSGYINGSNNGNYRNEDGKGNGNAYGLDKQDKGQKQGNGDDNNQGLINQQPDEKQSEQEQEQERNTGHGNKGGNYEQNRNENIDNGQNGDEDGDVDENEGDEDEEGSPDVSAIEARIQSIVFAEGKFKITFNLDLALAGAKVTAVPVNSHAQAIDGQTAVSDDRTLLVTFPPLESNKTYSIVAGNIALKDGTLLGDLKANYHVSQADKADKGGQKNNEDDKPDQKAEKDKDNNDD